MFLTDQTVEAFVEAYIGCAYRDYLNWSLEKSSVHKIDLERLKYDIKSGSFLRLTPFYGTIEPDDILRSWENDVAAVKNGTKTKSELFTEHHRKYGNTEEEEENE